MTDHRELSPPDALLVREIAERNIPCPGCGYNLRGLPSPVCPECGRRLRPADLRARPRQDTLFVLGTLGLVLALVLASLVGLVVLVMGVAMGPARVPGLALLVYAPFVAAFFMLMRAWYRHEARFNLRPLDERISMTLLCLLAPVAALGGPCGVLSLLDVPW